MPFGTMIMLFVFCILTRPNCNYDLLLIYLTLNTFIPKINTTKIDMPFIWVHLNSDFVILATIFSKNENIDVQITSTVGTLCRCQIMILQRGNGLLKCKYLSNQKMH